MLNDMLLDVINLNDRLFILSLYLIIRQSLQSIQKPY